MRSWPIKTLVLLAQVGLALVLAEAGLRLAHYQPAGGDLRGSMEFDPLLGWRHKPRWSGEIFGPGYRTAVQYNAHGFRGPDRPYRKPENTSRIVVLGPSLIDGYSVPLPERSTEVLEADLGPTFEVINLGVAGYGTDQELLMLETEGWKYQPDLVVLTITERAVMENGRKLLSNNSSTQKPLFVVDDGNLTLTNVPVPYVAPPWRERFKLYGALQTEVYQSDLVWLRWFRSLAAALEARRGKTVPGNASPLEAAEPYQTTANPEMKRLWSLGRALLHRAKQETDQRGVRLVVLYTPLPEEYSAEEWSRQRSLWHLSPDYDPAEPARRVGAICRAEGIPYLEPGDRFRSLAQQTDLFYKDNHWTSAGNRLAAEILAEYVRSSWRSGLSPRAWR